jgi:hypothetical protein
MTTTCGEPPLGHIALKPVLRDQPEPDQRVVIALWHDQRLTVSERCDRVRREGHRMFLCYWDSRREIEEGKA